MNAANLISILESTAYNMHISLEELNVSVKHIDGWIYSIYTYEPDGKKTIYFNVD